MKGCELSMGVIKKNDIFLADFGNREGSEQGGVRPVLILSNDVGNRFAPTVIIAPLTSNITKRNLPTHTMIKAGIAGLAHDSLVLTEQLQTIDKSKLISKLGSTMYDNVNNDIQKALEISLALAVA